MANVIISEKQKQLARIEEGQIGYSKVFQGPFGNRRVVYMDYTASGRSLESIESYIQREVLPLYGNTHTETSITGRQTTQFREEAREIIRSAVNASKEDSVIFAGSGCTGAVHKLLHVLNLQAHDQPPVVFVGPFEHHSNLLPWREIGATVIWIKENDQGLADISDLEEKLKYYSQSGRKMIGSFSAASNLTGVLTDTISFSCMLHKYGALAFWDFASAAPYVKIDMNPVVSASREDSALAYKDAVFFSMHKFVGGPDSPGVLVAKKRLFSNPVPSHSGGGTVFFVTPSKHRYFHPNEIKEEGGTPSIVGAIRAGLAMQVKEEVGVETITRREDWLSNYVYSCWKDIPELVLVGPSPSSAPRLPIFSFLIVHQHTGKYLHYGFVCALLNDLFGIQTRGGCMCAGPYAQTLLGIDAELADKYIDWMTDESKLMREDYVEMTGLRPGVTRLSFPYFLSQAAVEYVVKAVEMVAKHGWKLLPQYLIDIENGIFTHHSHQPDKTHLRLSDVHLTSGNLTHPSSSVLSAPSFSDILSESRKILEEAPSYEAVQHPPLTILGGNGKDMRGLLWFVLPSEVCLTMEGAENFSQAMAVPFTPKDYSNPTQANQGHTHPLHEKHGSMRSGVTDRRSEKLSKDKIKAKSSSTSSKLPANLKLLIKSCTRPAVAP